MGFKERLGRITPERLKKPFPIKATSFDNFVELAASKGVKSVKIEAATRAKDGGNSRIGYIGGYEYFTILTGSTLTGRKIKFEEKHDHRFGSDRGIGDEEERGRMSLKSFIVGLTREQELNEKLPHISTVGVADGLGEHAVNKLIYAARAINLVDNFDLIHNRRKK